MNKTKKQRNKNKKRNNNNTTKKNNIAGKVIGSGGFGCILQPQLKCSNPFKTYDKDGISKLMKTKYVNEELKEIKLLKKITKNIKNRNNYFLLNNVHSCKPKKFKENELKELKNCKNLSKLNINSNNINNKLNLLKVLNMPYGGIDIDDFWDIWIKKKPLEQNDIFNKVNNSLIDLLENAIIKFNLRYYYHADIKGSNILINPDTLQVKLIDWGLSEQWNKKNVLSCLQYKPIQFNLPYGNILNTDITNNELNYFNSILKIRGSTDYEIYKYSAIAIFHRSLNEISEGHISYINSILTHFYKNTIKKSFLKDYCKNIIIKQLTNILVNYTKNLKFNQDKYFNEVYRHNLDIWGFLMSYLEIPLKYKNINSNMLSNKLASILKYYCFEPNFDIKPIPVKSLIEDLKNCNNLLTQNINKDIAGLISLPYLTSIKSLKQPKLSKKINKNSRSGSKWKLYNSLKTISKKNIKKTRSGARWKITKKKKKN